jgi:hypothetical protein
LGDGVIDDGVIFSAQFDEHVGIHSPARLLLVVSLIRRH